MTLSQFKAHAAGSPLLHRDHAKSAVPPKPIVKAMRLEKHGDTRIDPYFWMRERDAAGVISYLNKENEYTKKILKPTEKLQKNIFKEMKGRMVEDESSAPYKKGPFYYYSRYKKGGEYPIFMRYPFAETMSKKKKESIILDGNVLAKNKDYFSLGALGVSPNHQMLAYAVDTVGRRFYNIYFKDLDTGKTFKENIPNTTGNMVWAKDNKTIYYSVQHPKTLRSYQVYRKTIGQKPVLIFEEKDELYSVSVDKSLSGEVLYIYSGGMTSNEILFADANVENPEFRVFFPREDKHEYSIDDGGDVFYVLSNWKAKNFCVFTCSKNKTDRKSWKEIVAHRKDVLIEDVTVFKNHLIFSERANGLAQIVHAKRDLKKFKKLKFPEAAHLVSLGVNAEYDTNTLRYVYESMVTPVTVFDLDLTTGKETVVKEKQVPTYKKANYASERIWAKGHDGVKIPISLVYNKKLFKAGKNPLLVYGYGSYGYSMDPDFSSTAVSLLDRGFVFAVAHIRGGSEMGREWYDNGKFLKKKNTFKDFISATEHLIHKKFGDPDRVYAMGGSAGGLLMGAVMNMRPDLYHGIVAAVPFVDVVTTMLDESIPLTTIEYEEWGNPNDPKYYKYMLSYSPYDNVKNATYPHTLIMSGYHDSQVQYWEPTKWAAKLRDHNQGNTKIILKTDMDAGHSGATGRYKSLNDTALEYSFLIWLASEHKGEK